MQFNEKFGMKDLFMNKELKGIFPQFNKKDRLQNVYSFQWVENKIAQYIKQVFNGYIRNGDVYVRGKYRQTYKEIKAMKQVLEDMFNNMPAITKNIRKNTKLITPFQCVDQLKEIQDPKKKLMAMQIVFDNLNYNPDFQSQNRFSTLATRTDYFKRQQIWMQAVGYDKIKRGRK